MVNATTMMHTNGIAGTCQMMRSHYFMNYGWFFQLLILVLFLLVAWWLLKSSGSFGFRIRNETAVDILNKRLASGQLSQEEYKKLKREIEK